MKRIVTARPEILMAKSTKKRAALVSIRTWKPPYDMKSTSLNSARRRAGIGVFLAAITLLASGCGRSNEHVVSGPFHVTYEVERWRHSGGGTYREIQILDKCVLLVGEDGKSGSIIPISKLNELNWRKE